MAIKITLTKEQAKLVSIACEFYARIKIGQFNEIVWNTFSFNPDVIKNVPAAEFCDRRDKAEEALLAARKFIYPELHGIGHSYGIGKFEDADMAFDIYQVIRPHFGDDRSPFTFSRALPLCERKEEGSGEGEFTLILTMPEEQAEILTTACDLFAKVKRGKFDRIMAITLDKNLPDTEYFSRRSAAETLLLAARQQIYPDLYPCLGCFYDTNKYEDAAVLEEIHYVVGNFLKGFSSYPSSPFPKIEKVKEKEEKKERKKK